MCVWREERCVWVLGDERILYVCVSVRFKVGASDLVLHLMLLHFFQNYCIVDPVLPVLERVSSACTYFQEGFRMYCFMVLPLQALPGE